MPDERLSRRRLIKAGGTAALTGTALGKAASAAAATVATRESSAPIGVLDAVRGRYGSATAEDGTTYAGRINSRRPLRAGDRVMIDTADDGSYAISPLYVDVVGIVDSVDAGSVRIGGVTYTVDSASVLRRPRGGQWVESGSTAAGVKAGTALEALGILNVHSGTTVLAVTWVP
jgi:hypothetical protein